MGIIDQNSFIDNLKIGERDFGFFSLPKLLREKGFNIENIPFCRRVLLENMLRTGSLQSEHLVKFTTSENQSERISIQFFPARILLQDFTGIPLLVDLASMRDEVMRLGKPPLLVNPRIPVDLVIDHSIQVDYFASHDAVEKNLHCDYQRNHERYKFLHWAQTNFRNLRIFPPSFGIVHQVNIEYLASLVQVRDYHGRQFLLPETVLGTDSHTTMVNGLGVLGWGVGGIEAIAAMLGEPVEISLPPVVGVHLTGRFPEGSMPTDLVLMVTELLREHGVVDKMVEFYGPGLDSLTPADRCMIANMAPEYGATAAYFPIDQQTLEYLTLTARPVNHVDMVRAYTLAQKLFREPGSPYPEYQEHLSLDIGKVTPAMAGPTRPQDRVLLNQVNNSFARFANTPDENPQKETLKDGSVVLAAITSCTNTSNPYAILAAGLLAKKAVEKGLFPKPYTKTSFAPGSTVVRDYLDQAELMKPLEALGFHIVGYGCTTCIGNSGPLIPGVGEEIRKNNLITTAVISGNRNFSGRVHPLVKANYLASPALVIAYAILGDITLDITSHPLGRDVAGDFIYLRDIWPTDLEIQACVRSAITSDLYERAYADSRKGDAVWNNYSSNSEPLYRWDPDSTYIQPSRFLEAGQGKERFPTIENARALLVLGDSITTDHISPAGSISNDSSAGYYLSNLGVDKDLFNSFGSRRGNSEVMVRGTFDNPGLINKLVPGKLGGFTRMSPEGEVYRIYNAAKLYANQNTPLIILAGKEYGTGSSRDWAAKGLKMLGVKAVIAESFERIHRSNLVMMGIIPLQFIDGEKTASLGLTGFETFTITELNENENQKTIAQVEALSPDNQVISFKTMVLINNQREQDYFSSGGVLPYLISLL